MVLGGVGRGGERFVVVVLAVLAVVAVAVAAKMLMVAAVVVGDWWRGEVVVVVGDFWRWRVLVVVWYPHQPPAPSGQYLLVLCGAHGGSRRRMSCGSVPPRVVASCRYLCEWCAGARGHAP